MIPKKKSPGYKFGFAGSDEWRPCNVMTDQIRGYLARLEGEGHLLPCMVMFADGSGHLSSRKTGEGQVYIEGFRDTNELMKIVSRPRQSA